MKLLNHTLLYFSVALLFILGVWATLFYVNMLDEVYDSLDDGLDNYKLLIIEKANTDSTVLHKTSFGESNYLITELPEVHALQHKDLYKDTLMYMQNEEDYEPVRLLTTVFEGPGNKYYQLKVISSMVEEDDLIEDLFYALIWLYVAMLLSILLLNNFLLKRIWKPFYSMLDQVKKFRLGKKETVEAPKTRVKEFRDMNKVLNELLQRNIDSFDQQKQFIENASHELQTPLAISLNKLELLAEKEGLPEEVAETIGQVMQTLERLTRLNKSLLLISKIENKQYENIEEVDLNTSLQKIIDEFSDYSSFRQVTFSYSEQGHFVHSAHKDLVEILLNNLVKNAIVHNDAGGFVQVYITPSSVIIKNTGSLKPLDPSRIFSRFYKSSSSSQSTGLGLAIVKAIADLYDLQVSYSFDGMHIMEIKK